jgi:hypothetical protein
MAVKLFLAICMIAHSSCSSHSQSKSYALNESPSQLLGENLDSLRNTSGKFVLFFQKQNLTSLNSTVKAVVVEILTKKIVASFTYTPGYCKWISESEIEVLNAPGMIRKEEDISKYITIIKVKSKVATP